MATSWRVGQPGRFVYQRGDVKQALVEPREAFAASISDWIASLANIQHNAQAVKYTRELLEQEWGLKAASIDDLFERIRLGADEMVAAFGMQPDDAELDAETRDGLLANSVVALAEMNLDVVEANEQLRKALHERDELARRLQDEVHKAQRIQRRLMPHDAS